jgi:hypothetical protein
MIVRILGEGQWEVPDGAMEELNRLDDAVTSAIDSNDENAFRNGINELLQCVRDRGTREPDDFLSPSDLVLPGSDSTIEEVKELLTDEGLVPD